MTKSSLIKFFRIIAVLEGISYVLFGITMPLKYIYDITEPNFFVGLIHGLLFMLYCAIGLRSAFYYEWKFSFSVLVFIASLIPFGTFFLDARYLKPQRYRI